MSSIRILGAFLMIIMLQYNNYGQDFADEYIDLYASIAVSEMNRSGVPASIKLAQALLESNYGRSEMATKANNHFGIKCGSNWNGGVYYSEDDDKNKHGQLIASCFRVYQNVEESYIEHSNFLRNNGRSSRYEFLFEYRKTDYKKWAHGLKKAGYATDPAYPKKLINLIEKHELYRFDDMGATHFAHSGSKSTNKKEPSLIGSRILNEETVSVSNPVMENLDFDQYNEVRMVLTSAGQSLSSIAGNNNMDAATLMRYNDGISSADQILAPKSRIYLEKKKIAFRGKKRFHQVMPGEKMAEISQHYAIDLEALYIRNKIPFGSEVVPGEVVQLKGLIRTSKRPRLKSKGRGSIAEKSRFVEETVEYLFAPKHGDKD